MLSFRKQPKQQQWQQQKQRQQITARKCQSTVFLFTARSSEGKKKTNTEYPAIFQIIFLIIKGSGVIK